MTLVLRYICLLLDLLRTAEETSAASSNKTNLLTWNCTTRNGRGLTDVLVVTTTMRVIYGVHGHTTSAGPRVALHLELVVGITGLEKGFVNTATASDDADNATGIAGEDLLGARGKLDACLVLVRVVTNDNDVVSGSASERASVADLFLNIGHDGTLGNRAKRENVTDGELGFLSSVYELAGVKTLVRNEGLGAGLVLVRIAEDDLCEGGPPARVVDNLLDKASGIAVALGIVESSELGSTLSEPGVGLENGTVLSLRSDNTTHWLTKKVWKIGCDGQGSVRRRDRWPSWDIGLALAGA